MQCQSINHPSTELTEEFSQLPLELVVTEGTIESWELMGKSIGFQTHFEGYMEMYSDRETVAEYLNAHQGWFCRCAEPMTVEPIGNNGYILTVGRFGSCGYEVEPKIAVVLHPPQDGIYWMNTIPVPNYTPPGYQVDYKASMELVEIPIESAGAGLVKAYKKQGISQLPQTITRVKWQLQMNVQVQFPRFIYKLPVSMIRGTGDRLLAQIIKQISPRLTAKVQEDFHSRHNLPVPPKTSRHLQVANSEDTEDCAA